MEFPATRHTRSHCHNNQSDENKKNEGACLHIVSIFKNDFMKFLECLVYYVMSKQKNLVKPRQDFNGSTIDSIRVVRS